MASLGKKNAYWLTPVFIVAVALVFYMIMRVNAKKPGQPNVLLITMDSLRHDQLGCTGCERAHTPNIDALAQDGVIFREAFAQGTFTRISVPSIITGLFPLFTGIRTFRGYMDSTLTTVAEVLLADGYATLATNQLWSRTFYQGFEEVGGSQHATTWRTDRAIKGIEEYRDRKHFIWLYYWDPHAPYEPPEEFMRLYEPDYVQKFPREMFAQDPYGILRDATGHFNGSIGTLQHLNAKKIRLTSADERHLTDLYNAEIAFVDAGIGELVEKLKDRDLYDRTLIIINSDHGEGFGEHGHWYHGSTVYDEMAGVPLIIKPPASRNANKVVWGQVRNIDIMATILDYCGLRAPLGCNGQSLRPFIETDAVPDLPVITETQVGKRAHLVALRHRGHKLIYDVINDKAWLYDLTTDPGEKISLLPDSSLAALASLESPPAALQLEGQLRQELLDVLQIDDLADLKLNTEDLGPLDERTKERLKALGYVY